MAHASTRWFQAALICVLQIALVLGQDGGSSYAPSFTECPDDFGLRDASEGLSQSEKDWWKSRSQKLLAPLKSYLELVDISGLDVTEYFDRLNASDAPIVGLSISGGGTQSGIGGLGVWQALDARHHPAQAAKTAGITQILSYVTGLSGGGAVTVSALSSTNFSSVQDIRAVINFSIPYVGGADPDSFYETIFENAGAKADAGFPVSVTDPFGQFWGNWLPKTWTYANFSDLATKGGSFVSGHAPMPIMVLAEVIPGRSPEIGGFMFPGRDDTNGFNLTSYEVTPFEFGSWLGGRVQAFMPTQWLGTAMENGSAVDSGRCVVGFDKFTFILGTTTNAFTAWLIDAFYDIPIFAKRGLWRRHGPLRDIELPPEAADNADAALVQDTASQFNQTFNESLWGTYPNPFRGYNDAMTGVSELLLVDGGLTGETNPIRPLIIPDRALDFIIIYEASSDAANAWVNGTNLINTAKSAEEGDIPFPKIPDVNTMVAQNLTRQPSFFGCDADDGTPLLLYLPNSPWTGYSNFSFEKESFTDHELDLTMDNAFQLVTFGNGTIDEEWPACLACAVIRGSLRRMDIDVPEQCNKCFERHCWDGTVSSTEATANDFDLRPMLNSSLTFDEWNTTIWSAISSADEDFASSLTYGKGLCLAIAMALGTALLNIL